MNSKISSGGELFLRGAERYVDALAAIAAFQKEVQDICTKVYDHYAIELAAQMGLDERDCDVFCEEDADERRAEVGISRPAQRDCTFCLYLSWGESKGADDAIAGAVSLGLYHTRLRDEIHRLFRQKNPGCRVETLDTYQLVLYQNLEDPASASDTLDTLVTDWLEYCKSVGGLKLRGRPTP